MEDYYSAAWLGEVAREVKQDDALSSSEWGRGGLVISRGRGLRSFPPPLKTVYEDTNPLQLGARVSGRMSVCADILKTSMF